MSLLSSRSLVFSKHFHELPRGGDIAGAVGCQHSMNAGRLVSPALQIASPGGSLKKAFYCICITCMGGVRNFLLAVAEGHAYIVADAAALQQKISEFRVQCPERGLVPNESYVSQT
jgi:hypothetical protein